MGIALNKENGSGFLMFPGLAERMFWDYLTHDDVFPWLAFACWLPFLIVVLLDPDKRLDKVPGRSDPGYLGWNLGFWFCYAAPTFFLLFVLHSWLAKTSLGKAGGFLVANFLISFGWTMYLLPSSRKKTRADKPGKSSPADE
jgi:hypothetical protein